MSDDVQIWNEDCVTGMAAHLAANSIDLSVMSIPFGALFQYSGKPEDVGNNADGTDFRASQFGLHTRFFLEQLFRVTRPGCNVCIHIQQLLRYKNQHGYMGRRDLPLLRLNTRADMIRWCADKSDTAGWFAITNYEKMIPQEDSPQQVVNELRFLTAVIADESSILKTKGGTIKWALMKSTYGVPYKLSCTATPAPNDQLEYLSQAGFLDKFNDNTGDGPALASFFKLEADGSCKLKPHARSAFFNFMVAWSIYLRKPSAFGFRDPFAEVPEPVIEEIKVAATVEQESEAAQYLRARDPRYLFASEKLGVTQRGKLSQIAKGFVYGGKAPRRIASRKPGVVAELTRQACREGRQVLVWTVFDEESEIIMEQLRDEQVVALHGKQSEDEREKILAAFVRGEITGLVSKAALLGYGLNFPFCTRMIFSGFDDSFERFYQAVRRCYRYGSREQLRVMVPYIPGLENHVWENVLRKKSQWEADTAECEQAYAAAMRRGLLSTQ